MLIGSKEADVARKVCDCRDKSKCPLPHLGCMAEKSVVYQAKVVRTNNNHVKTYSGLTGDYFKVRWQGHNHNFSHPECHGNTVLAGYIWELNNPTLAPQYTTINQKEIAVLSL